MNMSHCCNFSLIFFGKKPLFRKYTGIHFLVVVDICRYDVYVRPMVVEKKN